MLNWNYTNWEVFLEPYTGRLLTAIAALAFLAFALLKVREEGWIRWTVVAASGLSLISAALEPCLALDRYSPRWRLPIPPFAAMQAFGVPVHSLWDFAAPAASICCWGLLAIALVAARRAERAIQVDAAVTSDIAARVPRG